MIYLEKLEEAKKKKGRCWTGYKPKPGSVPYSKGSCVKEAYKLIGLALTDLEESAAKEAGLSPKQYRRMMVGKRRALGNNPNPALARGFERGATEQLKKEQARKKKKALDVAHTSYQQIGDILAEGILGKIRSKVAGGLKKFSRKQYRKGEVDDASGKPKRASIRGRIAHMAGKLALDVDEPKKKG